MRLPVRSMWSHGVVLRRCRYRSGLDPGRLTRPRTDDWRGGLAVRTLGSGAEFGYYLMSWMVVDEGVAKAMWTVVVVAVAAAGVAVMMLYKFRMDRKGRHLFWW